MTKDTPTEGTTLNVVIVRNIEGENINLPEGRSVFVGRMAGEDSVYIRFVSAEGKNTDIRISEEAADALRRLLSGKEEPGSEVACIEVAAADQWILALHKGAEAVHSEAAEAV